MAERVYVVGVGMTDFVKPSARPEWDYPDMAREAGQQALHDAGVTYEQVEQVAVGYCFGDTASGQSAVYELGLTVVPVINVNNAFASGSTALYVARNSVAGGMLDCTLLTRLQCCPTSSGAAAAVLASERFVRTHGLVAGARVALQHNLGLGGAGLVTLYRRSAL